MSLGVRRTDLNGSGRAGKGTWRVVALRQPQTALLPADEPPMPQPTAPKPALVTAGDEVRSRMSPGYSAEATVRSWGEGAERARGELTHGADGAATIRLAELPAGAWRVLYETRDDFDATWAMSYNLIVSGEKSFPVKLPALLEAEHPSVDVGGTARFLVGSAFAGQRLLYEVYRSNRLIERRWLDRGHRRRRLLEASHREDRGGFAVVVSVVRDWQVMQFQESIHVPWDDKTLSVEFSTFRDTLRPGAQETFRVTVKGQGKALEAGAAEVLAYMYDQSLDLFAPHFPPSVPDLYPNRAFASASRVTLGQAAPHGLSRSSWYQLPDDVHLRDDSLTYLEGWGIGGMGPRGYGHRMRASGMAESALSDAAPMSAPALAPPAESETMAFAQSAPPPREKEAKKPEASRARSERGTGCPSSAAFELLGDRVLRAAPHDRRQWHGDHRAHRARLGDRLECLGPRSDPRPRGGGTKKVTRSVKDLMVRPYLPRFLRESDQADLKVVVNNASKGDLAGELLLDIVDPDTQKAWPPSSAVPGAAALHCQGWAGRDCDFPVTAPQARGARRVQDHRQGRRRV